MPGRLNVLGGTAPGESRMLRTGSTQFNVAGSGGLLDSALAASDSQGQRAMATKCKRLMAGTALVPSRRAGRAASDG
ncbi:hypothetical protein D3C79_790540 [compost metagenome]